jgi:hypothetical protein
VADGLSSNQESTRIEVPPGTTRTSYLVSGTSLGLQVPLRWRFSCVGLISSNEHCLGRVVVDKMRDLDSLLKVSAIHCIERLLFKPSRSNILLSPKRPGYNANREEGARRYSVTSINQERMRMTQETPHPARCVCISTRWMTLKS